MAAAKKKRKKNARLPPKYGGPMEVRTKIGQYSYVGEDGDYDVYRIRGHSIGVIDGLVMDGLPEDDPRRWYSYSLQNYWEAEARTLEDALDKAYLEKNPKKSSKKKTAKKKTAKKKRSKKSAKGGFKRVPQKDYEIVWDKRYESCKFGHRKGIGGELGAGVNDVIEVYTDGKFMYVLSMNYTEGYACVEAFDGKPGGCASLCFGLPEDIEKALGKPLEEAKPTEVLEALTC